MSRHTKVRGCSGLCAPAGTGGGADDAVHLYGGDFRPQGLLLSAAAITKTGLEPGGIPKAIDAVLRGNVAPRWISEVRCCDATSHRSFTHHVQLSPATFKESRTGGRGDPGWAFASARSPGA